MAEPISSSKESFSLRAATKADFSKIKALIKQARINPTKLDWRRFSVAILGSGPNRGKVIGCGQMKPVPRNLVELASLAVDPKYQGQGVGRAMIEYLLSNAPRPVYLTCRSGLGVLYEKFGFRALDPDEMPVYYRRIQSLVSAFVELTRRNETLLVMKLG